MLNGGWVGGGGGALRGGTQLLPSLAPVRAHMKLSVCNIYDLFAPTVRSQCTI